MSKYLNPQATSFVPASLRSDKHPTLGPPFHIPKELPSTSYQNSSDAGVNAISHGPRDALSIRPWRIWDPYLCDRVLAPTATPNVGIAMSNKTRAVSVRPSPPILSRYCGDTPDSAVLSSRKHATNCCTEVTSHSDPSTSDDMLSQSRGRHLAKSRLRDVSRSSSSDTIRGHECYSHR